MRETPLAEEETVTEAVASAEALLMRRSSRNDVRESGTVRLERNVGDVGDVNGELNIGRREMDKGAGNVENVGDVSTANGYDVTDVELLPMINHHLRENLLYH
ncbi:hypothetical protein BWQ96_07458 [Gracilariopsis chorda]|uniref:Uncharacterized protein n=1 Tax=Gracilariopsis chorda TaxID=448386 RepID=A0A2V3IL89_9FLOR|nr:hypothetical protein BWQ96_07458 [Gracilariopsis chorda]|eukprot:PXF42807.1 hypothetical protein BWQ96_07458 [Gracilariopsis chorda]